MTYTASKQKAIDELVLNEERHRYTLRGVSILNVSTVVDSMMDFHGRPEQLEEARQRGRLVHEHTALYDLRVGPTPVPDMVVPYLQAWVKFCEECGFIPQGVEQRVLSRKHLFAGTYDRVGPMDGELWLLDIKTGMYYPEYELQTAAYVEAANEGRVGEKVKKRAAVQLKSDGTYVFHDHNQPKNKHDLAVFLAQLTVYEWKGRQIWR